ncbi:PaaX family transcriptional regulator C-terminal domain-containing protein [Streptomyces sp. NPDC050504]|uniref:PaaX family transcriptional regulator C-terminal domain-containing protein n=1 Tax=Streptomyces sp. NPDC050504 TaxID=3365618 RepID=UPI003791084C
MTTATAPDDSAWPPIPTRLLVHALVREDGTVDAGELYDVAGRLGMTDQQVRLCIKRLVAEGRFTHEGRGRKALLRAVPDATGSVAPDVAYVRHAYRQDHGLAPWDGVWHLFAFAVPEARRTARDALRDTLLHLGAAPVQSGLYVSANRIGELVGAEAHRLGLAAQVTTFTSTDLSVGGVHEPAELAAALWPLDEVAARHTRLTALARTCLDRLGRPDGPTAAERLTLAVRLAAAFSQAMEPDPLLPPELLPRPWPGAEARRVTAECWSALAATATTASQESGTPAPRLFALYEGVREELGEELGEELSDASIR